MNRGSETKPGERIALLYGGKSGEHEVSLRSAASVAKHLNRQRYKILLIGISREGRWYLQPDVTPPRDTPDMLEVIEDDRELVAALPGTGLLHRGEALQIDVVFPVLHGTFGEDGTVQGLLELLDLPYVGAGVLGSSLSMDKATAKDVWVSRGLPVVPFVRIESLEFSRRGPVWEEKLTRVKDEFGLPLFVKPVRAGSSVGVSRVDHWEELNPAVSEALRYDTAAMAEPAIGGREIECSVIGNRETLSFPPGEILPSHEFYDYEAKYIDPDGAVLRLPAEIPAATATEIRRTAEEAYRAAGVDGMARVDFFLEEPSGRVLLNEINTIPGFTSISMFPRMCEAGGLEYSALLSRLIELGKERAAERAERVYSVLVKTGAEG